MKSWEVMMECVTVFNVSSAFIATHNQSLECSSSRKYNGEAIGKIEKL